MLPKDNTPQEKTVRQCLRELGIRFEEQVNFDNYTVDFYIPEINIVIEADGIYGHLKKGDAKRDVRLKQLGAKEIFHLRDFTKQKIMDRLKEMFNSEEVNNG